MLFKQWLFVVVVFVLFFVSSRVAFGCPAENCDNSPDMCGSRTCTCDYSLGDGCCWPVCVDPVPSSCGGTRGSCGGSCPVGETCEAPSNPQNGNNCACRGGGGGCSTGSAGGKCCDPYGVCNLDINGNGGICCNEVNQPGVCAATHYDCNYGTPMWGSEDATNWYWTCLGTGGGADTACSESKTIDCGPWLPDYSYLNPADYCTTQSVTQTNACNQTKTTYGTKICCAVTSWTPDVSGLNPADYCTSQCVKLTSNCGDCQVVCGTQNCGGSPSVSCTACIPSWGACSVSCGGGTQSDGCGHIQACNTQSCNVAPAISLVTITNSVGTVLTADASNRNNICESVISNSVTPRQVRFVITATDANGGANIASISLSWNGRNYTAVLQAASGNSRVGVVTVNFADSDNATGIYPLIVTVRDAANATGTNNTRLFKVWNCNVPVSGTMYDSTDNSLGAVCSTGVGFSVLASAAMNFTSANVGSTVWSATGGNTYTGNLAWSKNYLVTPNSDLMASGTITRWIDLGVGTTSCGPSQTLTTAVVNPYVVNPRLQIDFSAIRNQEPWFQTSGGGIQASGSIANMIPITCANSPLTCTAAMSKESLTGASNNGLVSGSSITNNSGCGTACVFGTPNNWYKTTTTISTHERYGYQYFYDKYFSSLGLGITLPAFSTMTEVLNRGGTGVFLVNGDFNVDVDNTLPNGSFLMIVSKGTITFLSSVNNSAGMFVADAGIGTSPGVNTTLTIGGILYSPAGNVRLNRGFANTMDNNSKAGVLVSYRPDLVFSMPGKLFKLLSGWRQF